LWTSTTAEKKIYVNENSYYHRYRRRDGRGRTPRSRGRSQLFAAIFAGWEVNIAVLACVLRRRPKKVFNFLSKKCAPCRENPGYAYTYTVKPVFFARPLFREPGKFAKITGRENLNTVAFQCSRKQKR